MNMKLFLIPLVGISLVACNQADKKAPPPHQPVSYQEADNTGKNVRDRDPNVVTPFDQSESEADRTITKDIRQEIAKNNTFSLDAKNIKIVTNKGVVVLRGPVKSDQEKMAIEKVAKGVKGVTSVNNQLEVVVQK